MPHFCLMIVSYSNPFHWQKASSHLSFLWIVAVGRLLLVSLDHLYLYKYDHAREIYIHLSLCGCSWEWTSACEVDLRHVTALGRDSPEFDVEVFERRLLLLLVGFCVCLHSSSAASW